MGLFSKRGNQHHADVCTPDVRSSADRAAEDHGVGNLSNEANLNCAIEKFMNMLPHDLIQKRLDVIKEEVSIAAEKDKRQAMAVELHKTVAELLVPIAAVLRDPARQELLDPDKDAVQDIYNVVKQSLTRSTMPSPKINESEVYLDYRRCRNRFVRGILDSADTALRNSYLELNRWYSGANVGMQRNPDDCWCPTADHDLINGLIDDHVRQTNNVAIRIKDQQEQMKQLTAKAKHT